jgi:hypothetical protein
MDFPHTCLAVCTIQNETTFLLAPIIILFICIVIGAVVQLSLHEKPLLVLFASLFSLFFLISLVGTQHTGSGCGSGCEKNSTTITLQIWPWDEEPLWQHIKYGW